VFFGARTDQQSIKEIVMNSIFTKVGVVAAAVAMNGAIMAGVAYLFALQGHAQLVGLA
jgi:hypothetical protein